MSVLSRPRYASGGLSLESACRVSYFRGLLAGKLREANISSPGAMLSINLAPHHVSEYLEKTGVTTVNVACINSPFNVPERLSTRSNLGLTKMASLRRNSIPGLHITHHP